jgi:hypothetical protein
MTETRLWSGLAFAGVLAMSCHALAYGTSGSAELTGYNLLAWKNLSCSLPHVLLWCFLKS